MGKFKDQVDAATRAFSELVRPQAQSNTRVVGGLV
jgi:hypothetical protein